MFIFDHVWAGGLFGPIVKIARAVGDEALLVVSVSAVVLEVVDVIRGLAVQARIQIGLAGAVRRFATTLAIQKHPV